MHDSLCLQVGPHYPNSTPLGSPGSSDELAMSHGCETRSVPNTPSRANLSRSFDAAVHSGNPDAPLEPPLNSLRDTTPPNSTHSTAASSLNRAQQPPAGPPVVPHELPQNDFKSDFAVADDEVTADASIDAAPADVREAANAELHNAAHTVSEHDPEVRSAVSASGGTSSTCHLLLAAMFVECGICYALQGLEACY